MTVTKITRQDLKGKIDAGEQVTLVEALGKMYYDKEHLPGAVNIPLDDVDALAPRLLPDKAAFIAVYCANGPCANSGIVSRRLGQLGYTNVVDYHEGKADWIGAGLPVESTVLTGR